MEGGTAFRDKGRHGEERSRLTFGEVGLLLECVSKRMRKRVHSGKKSKAGEGGTDETERGSKIRVITPKTQVGLAGVKGGEKKRIHKVTKSRIGLVQKTQRIGLVQCVSSGLRTTRGKGKRFPFQRFTRGKEGSQITYV